MIDSSMLWIASNLNSDSSTINNNRVVFYATASISSLMENNNYRSIFLNKSNYNGDNELNLNDIISQNSNLKAEFEYYISKYSQCKGPFIQTYEQMLNYMAINQINYYPVIYFVNKVNSAGTNKFAIAIDKEYILDNDPNVNEDSGKIPAWVNIQDSIYEVLISQSEANSASYPILIISQSTEFMDSIRYEEIDSIIVEEGFNKKTSQNWGVDYFEIKKKYEHSKWSEIKIANVQWNSNGTYYSSPPNPKKVIDVPTNAIPCRPQAHQLVEDYPRLTGGGYWLVIYEHDWYTAKKGVLVNRDYQAPSTNFANGGMPIRVRMGLANEFYCEECVNFCCLHYLRKEYDDKSFIGFDMYKN